ncbi:hypothetical protein [Vermiculatibacterium agrestimuris]|uniref:hypothetical protein n=1 Tax=Vermiculatibacterium agrestimuris TaxID=2941519 RepID=UPI00203B050E|nr:hypothetical protein [Vermiculatibacterium agrestimuris]
MKTIFERAGPVLQKARRELGRLLGLYMDDLLLIAGGACVTRGVYELTGRPWALLTAGLWLTAYAVVVARSKGGGG